MKVNDSKRIYLLIFIACVANGLTVYLEQFISSSGQHTADYTIPIFAWPGIWLLSLIVSISIFKKIKIYKSGEQKIMVYVILLFCTPIPLIYIAKYFYGWFGHR